MLFTIRIKFTYGGEILKLYSFTSIKELEDFLIKDYSCSIMYKLVSVGYSDGSIRYYDNCCYKKLK